MPMHGRIQYSSLACPVSKRPHAWAWGSTLLTSAVRRTTCSKLPTFPAQQTAAPLHIAPACRHHRFTVPVFRDSVVKPPKKPRTAGASAGTWINRWLCLKGCIANSTRRGPRESRSNYRGVTRIQTCRRSQTRLQYTIRLCFCAVNLRGESGDADATTDWSRSSSM